MTLPGTHIRPEHLTTHPHSFQSPVLPHRTLNHVISRLTQSRRQAHAPTDDFHSPSDLIPAQPTNWRRSDDPEYQDDPEFNRFTTDLSDRLFSLTANISRLSNQVALLGTRRETDRVRERVQDLLEETSESFKDIGEGLKKVQAWHDLGVCLLGPSHYPYD